MRNAADSIGQDPPEERVKRESAPRIAPIRSPQHAAFTAHPPQPAVTPAAPAAHVAEAVQTAYRVFEDYFQRGAAAAAAARLSPVMPGATAAPRGGDLASMAVSFWTSLAEQWMAPLLRAGDADPRSAWDHGTGPSTERPAVAAPRRSLTVVVSSDQPAEVTLDVNDNARVEHLAVQPLHPVEPARGPAISSITLREVDGRLGVEVAVPRGQPEGAYVGVIVDRARGEAAGSVRLVVGPGA